jgi:hypothetical protein
MRGLVVKEIVIPFLKNVAQLHKSTETVAHAKPNSRPSGRTSEKASPQNDVGAGVVGRVGAGVKDAVLGNGQIALGYDAQNEQQISFNWAFCPLRVVK